MKHGEEQPIAVVPEMLDDPHMWWGLMAPIETGTCECEALCECDE